MNIDSKYQSALDYLYSFIDYSLTRQQTIPDDVFNLTRIEALMDALGNPQQTYRSVHVAGTKGKGSICVLCASALQAQGYRVGLYTSPHLKDFEERIQIDRQPITKEQLVEIVEEIKPFVASVPRLTTFEITTALAFWYFARNNIDVGIIEVGLGGRLDATNVLKPDVSVISSISLDHMYLLGNSVEEIAAEKAGIIKPGIPVVVAPQKVNVERVISRIAEQQSAKLIQIGKDFRHAPGSLNENNQELTIWPVPSRNGFPRTLQIRLLGRHQADNAATAYATLSTLRDLGIELSEDSIHSGFAGCEWPARFEILRHSPPFIVDSAHNPDSAQKLRMALDDIFPDKDVILIIGVSEDKDVDRMMQELSPRVKRVMATQSTHPRAMDPETLKELIFPIENNVEAFPSVSDAIEEALRSSSNQEIILITGSIFVAATGRIAWQERAKRVTS